MRCKKHITDLSSTIGVCATCLREKLLPLLAVQYPPLIFPRSVSPPRVAKSTVDPDRLFYSTPQLGPTIPALRREREKRRNNFSLLPKFLRSGATSSSPSWISALFSGRTRKPPPPPPAAECRRTCRGRGMSPARVSDCGGDDFDNGGSSGYSTTPRRSGAPAGRRSGSGSQNVAAFCLSPLVRPSPNRRRDQAAEVAAGKPHLGAAAAFCANRSRKMADFGRMHPRQ